MRKPVLSIFIAGALLALFAMPAAAAHGGEPTVVVMQHLCNPDIQSEADFTAVENEGAGGEPGGEGTLPGLVATVLACPTVFLPSDTGTGGIAAEPTEFDYTIVDSASANYTLSSDGAFMAAELCESDINLDADGNGEISADTCLDVSMYGFAPTAEGPVTITQTTPPGDSRFGAIRFTPASTDELALIAAAEGVIELDTTADTQVDEPPLPLDEYNDDVIVAHIYNFQNAAGGEMPNTAVPMGEGTPAGTNPLTPVALAGVALLAGSVGTIAVARSRR